MVKQNLLTDIPTPKDLQNNPKFFKESLENNQKANFKIEITRVLDMIIQNLICRSTNPPYSTLVETKNSEEVCKKVVQKLQKKGWRANYNYCDRGGCYIINVTS
jgi:hypothetical protein